MNLGQFNIGREQMPSFDDFNKNPTHLMNMKQERLQRLLNTAPLMQQPQAMTQPAAPTQNATGGEVRQTSRGQNRG